MNANLKREVLETGHGDTREMNSEIRPELRSSSAPSDSRSFALIRG